MQRPNAVGFCPRCAEPVAAYCAVANHGLHFLLSLISLGVWLPIWLLVAFHGCTCRCRQCGRRFARCRVEPVIPIFSDTDPTDSRTRFSRAASLHGLLISTNLVYYMPTTAVRR